MNVELSPGTVKKAEQLVLAGEYPDIDSAIAAALDGMTCRACAEPRPYDPLDEEADADIAAGRTHVADDAFMAELRAEAEAIIASKRRV
jgi:Arc/MetJ-type ribon-helix-helix transcriptional regulator